MKNTWASVLDEVDSVLWNDYARQMNGPGAYVQSFVLAIALHKRSLDHTHTHARSCATVDASVPDLRCWHTKLRPRTEQYLQGYS